MTNPTVLYQTASLKDNQVREGLVAVNEPIRESFVVFIIKIAAVLIFTDVIYAILNFILLRALFLNHELPFNIYNYIPYVLTLLHIAKTTVQVWSISTIVFRWIGNSYFITEKHLVRHEGILNNKEKIYDLDIVRSVSVQQSWLGKVFRYGTVNVEISASGGYTDKVILNGISNPLQYEKMLRRHF